MMTTHNQPKRGFTMIELLVVIAILSMLISILLPSLHRARVKAKNMQCNSRLRSIYTAHVAYIHDHGTFSPLNNELDDGKWQYNYVIYDGDDFDNNFGPLVADGNSLLDINLLYCPLQTDPYHSLSTAETPWPVVPLLETRSGYARRYHLSGRSLSQFRGNPAIFADIFHLPKVIESAHKTGVNAVYLDGHIRWVEDQGDLTDNELTHPFALEDNDIMEDLWDELNRAGL